MNHATPAATADARTRFVFLDGLRGIAALAIVIHHFTANSGHRELFASATMAVDFFFCLSGFVIAHAYHDRLVAGMPLADYAGRRLARLYPLYLVGLVAGFVAILALKHCGLTTLSGSAIAEAFALNFLYLPYFNDSVVTVYAVNLVGTIFPFNNPGWSLFFGMLANLVYAILIRHSRHAPLLGMCAAAAGLCMATAAYGEAPGWGTDNFVGGFPRVFYAFFAGVAIFQARSRAHEIGGAWPLLIVCLAVFLFAVPRFESHVYYWLVGSLILAPAFVAISSMCVVKSGTTFARLCDYSGRMSYSVFCVHYPILMIMSVFVAPDPYYPALGITYIAVTLMFAHVALRFVEGPLRAWISASWVLR